MISWAGMCPGNHEGMRWQRYSGRARKGSLVPMCTMDTADIDLAPHGGNLKVLAQACWCYVHYVISSSKLFNTSR